MSFGYDAAVEVLHDIDLTVQRAGEVLAVTGATAAGKSTLCLLLGNLMPPTSGVVSVSGVDVADIEPDGFRDAVATVFQDTFLFADTVHENLVVGADPAPDPDAVAWATRLARADRFIAALPDGIDTVIGERGVSLSGGQRQRLALARALVRRPRLLLLDDATSAVDPRVEQQILDGLQTELHVTTVIVAHRVSTIMLADRVVFLDDGRIAAVGPHDELLATVPAYAALVQAYEDLDDEPEVDDDEPEDPVPATADSARHRGRRRVRACLQPAWGQGASDSGSRPMSDHSSELPHLHAERPTPTLEVERRAEAQRLSDDLDAQGALSVLRRGIAVTPELRAGIWFTVAMAVVNALGRLAVPVLIQQALDNGVLNPHGFDGRFVYTSCAATFVAVVVAYFVGWATYRRLIRAAENTLYGLRVKVFAHIHALAIADHEDSRRGVLVSRVTSDIETLARFVEWGAVSWMINGTVLVGVLIVMFIYCWQLALVTTVAFIPLAYLLQLLQRRQLKAYDVVRSRVGDHPLEVHPGSRSAGPRLSRSYGLQRTAPASRLTSAIRQQYRSRSAPPGTAR